MQIYERAGGTYWGINYKSICPIYNLIYCKIFWVKAYNIIFMYVVYEFLRYKNIFKIY